MKSYKKPYFIYKFRGNKNVKKTMERLEHFFGKGYLFDQKYPLKISKKFSRKEIKDIFTKDMKKGKFDLVVVDITLGKGRFMKQEITLAKKLKIPIIEVNFFK
jgi:hypothetical protein